MINLRNDYNSVGDKTILKELIKYADKRYIGYGYDEVSIKLRKKVSKMVKRDVDTYILPGGTSANVIGLNQMLKETFHAVMTVDSSHINVHETGAIEATGHKVIYVPSKGGKIDIDKIEEVYYQYKEDYMVKPTVLYLSNATELGETYTFDELVDISYLCKHLGLYFFIDGARLPQALVSEGYNLELIASLCDMFYLGGTKNGLPYGELLVIVNDELKEDFSYLLKNRLGLFAKGFVGAIMFLRYLKDDYYLALANNAIQMASILKEGLKDIIIYPNKTNQTFVKIPLNAIDELKEKIDFEVWEEHDDFYVIRLVTSFNTKKEDIQKCLDIFHDLF